MLFSIAHVHIRSSSSLGQLLEVDIDHRESMFVSKHISYKPSRSHVSSPSYDFPAMEENPYQMNQKIESRLPQRRSPSVRSSSSCPRVPTILSFSNFLSFCNLLLRVSSVYHRPLLFITRVGVLKSFSLLMLDRS